MVVGSRARKLRGSASHTVLNQSALGIKVDKIWVAILLSRPEPVLLRHQLGSKLQDCSEAEREATSKRHGALSM